MDKEIPVKNPMAKTALEVSHRNDRAQIRREHWVQIGVSARRHLPHTDESP